MLATYEQMNIAANEVEAASVNYMNSIKKMYDVIETLNDVWEGADKDKYVSTVESYKEDIAKLGGIINDYANFLRIAASDLQQTQTDITTSANRL